MNIQKSITTISKKGEKVTFYFIDNYVKVHANSLLTFVNDCNEHGQDVALANLFDNTLTLYAESPQKLEELLLIEKDLTP